jgi:signal transduction histidine kinase
MLKEGVFGPLSPRQASTVDRILVNTQRLLATINSLLDQARIEADELKLHYAAFDPADLLHDVEKIMGSLAESKGLAFHTAIDGVPNPIVGDRQRLHQIVMNLVDNALKFTDEGEINVRFGAAGLAWTIEVRDTGRGIPQEEQSQLFAPFYQIDSSTTREQGGVGLGLAIVRQLATAMGGEVLLDSEVGVGSTFMVILPIKPIAQDAPAIQDLPSKEDRTA